MNSFSSFYMQFFNLHKCSRRAASPHWYGEGNLWDNAGLKVYFSSTLDGSCRILFSILIWCPYNLDTLFTCCFHCSLLSITTPKHLMVLVYSMIVLTHLTEARAQPDYASAKSLITSDLPLCKVNLFESHQPQISANSKFIFPTTSSLQSPIIKAVVSSTYRCNSSWEIDSEKSLT